MRKLLYGIKYDFSFIKSHTLQPGWWKVMKIFVILVFLAGARNPAKLPGTIQDRASQRCPRCGREDARERRFCGACGCRIASPGGTVRDSEHIGRKEPS